MFKKAMLGIFSLVISASAFISNSEAACLGVSRTINISSFNAAMGASPSGGIGLRHKEVVLTFDDGPMPGTTSRILSALSAECTRATFFMVGNMAMAYPSMVRKVARSGHTIAHHTQSHDHLPGTSLSSARRQIQNGVAMVNRALGPMKNRSSRLFRYPYLARNAALDRVLRENRLLPFSANIDSTDWKSISPGMVVNRVMSQLNTRGRGVILLHDIQSRTASALPTLLDRLKAGGYKVVHIRAGNARTPKLVSLGPSSKARKKVGAHRHVDKTTTASVKRERRTVRASASGKPRKSLFSNWLKRRADAKKAKSKTVKKRAAAKRKVASVKRSSKKSLSWLERRRAASLARAKKSTKKVSKKRVKSKAKKRKFSFFRGAIKRKPGESTQAYHHRVKRARAKSDR